MMQQILVVEDDLVLQRMYVNTLIRAGFSVTTAVNAQEAMTGLAGNQIDLVVLDIMLAGGKNGFDILEEMKSNPGLRTIPVIVCTNLDSEKNTALEIGAADYIIKSNTPVDELVTKINNVLTNRNQNLPK
jgi:DNA-binding response OmpR family regulator